MAVPSDGSYGVPEGLISSFPCTVKDGKYEIVYVFGEAELAEDLKVGKQTMAVLKPVK